MPTLLPIAGSTIALHVAASATRLQGKKNHNLNMSHFTNVTIKLWWQKHIPLYQGSSGVRLAFKSMIITLISVSLKEDRCRD